MTRQQPQYITGWKEGSTKDNIVNEGGLWDSHEGVPRKEAWFPHHGTLFIGILEFRVMITDYLRKVLYEFPETIQGRVETPAEDHLFMVRYNTDRKLLEKERSAAFNHAVSQLIFSTPWVRKDIQTVVAFLMTRARTPDENNWWKLRRVLQCIIYNIHMPLIVRVGKFDIFKWRVGASYAMNPEC